MTSALTLCLIAAGLATAIAAAFVFVGAVRTGMMDDLEETKYRFIREDDHE